MAGVRLNTPMAPVHPTDQGTAIIEHRFSYCQEENVAGGGSPQRALSTQRKDFINRFRVITPVVNSAPQNVIPAKAGIQELINSSPLTGEVR